MTMTTTRDDDQQRLLETMRRFDTAMLVTHGASGELHARPMIISDVTEEGVLWFATNEHTPKVTEVDQDRRAVAIMQSDQLYVSVSGHIRTVTKDDLVTAHLSDDAKTWLDPKGGAATGLALQPLTGEIWDCSVDETVRTAVRMALLKRPAATPPSAPLVEHVVVPFSPA
jgi:general stress protein 26